MTHNQQDPLHEAVLRALQHLPVENGAAAAARRLAALADDSQARQSPSR